MFGAYALARGIVGLVMAIGNSDMEGRGWLFASSLAGIAVGVIVFADTGMSALALLYVSARTRSCSAPPRSALRSWLPLPGGDSALLGLTGVVSIAFGVVMFAKPGDGALALLALIAAYAVIIGLAELTVAIGGKRVFGFGRALLRRREPAGLALGRHVVRAAPARPRRRSSPEPDRSRPAPRRVAASVVVGVVALVAAVAVGIRRRPPSCSGGMQLHSPSSRSSGSPSHR